MADYNRKYPNINRVNNASRSPGGAVGDGMHGTHVDVAGNMHGVSGLECPVCDERALTRHFQFTQDADSPVLVHESCSACGYFAHYTDHKRRKVPNITTMAIIILTILCVGSVFVDIARSVKIYELSYEVQKIKEKIK